MILKNCSYYKQDSNYCDLFGSPNCKNCKNYLNNLGELEFKDSKSDLQKIHLRKMVLAGSPISKNQIDSSKYNESN